MMNAIGKCLESASATLAASWFRLNTMRFPWCHTCTPTLVELFLRNITSLLHHRQLRSPVTEYTFQRQRFRYTIYIRTLPHPLFTFSRCPHADIKMMIISRQFTYFRIFTLIFRKWYIILRRPLIFTIIASISFFSMPLTPTWWLIYYIFK